MKPNALFPTRMNRALTLALAFLFPIFSLADAVDSPERALNLKERLETKVSKMEGVNGIGVTGCEPTQGTRTEDFDQPFVHCVVIMTETEAAFEKLSQLYPVGTKLDGVFIVVDHVGPISPHPRGSAGN